MNEILGNAALSIGGGQGLLLAALFGATGALAGAVGLLYRDNRTDRRRHERVLEEFHRNGERTARSTLRVLKGLELRMGSLERRLEAPVTPLRRVS